MDTPKPPISSRLMDFYISLISALGNGVGVILVILYFRITETVPGAGVAYPYPYYAVVVALLIGIGIISGQVWAKKTRAYEKLDPSMRESFEGLEEVRATALNTPLMAATVSLFNWFLAAILIALAGPVIFDSFDPVEATTAFIGIALIGGPVTSICVFFSVEAIWRQSIPKYFGRSSISKVPGAIRIPVRWRLIMALLVVSLVPLFILGMSAFSLTRAMAQAGPEETANLLSTLTRTIFFMIGTGAFLSISVAFLLSRSISPPLKAITRAMSRIRKGKYDSFVPPVTNDEIGSLTDGFNRMAEGLAEREQLRATFDKFVDKEIAAQVLDSEANLDGEMKDVTALFADLRGFTTFSQAHHPSQVLAKLNRYFSAMTAVVQARGGVVVQYVGDELYAVFGAPKPNPTHAEDAYTAALEMRAALAELNREWTDAGEETFAHGIGLHSGLALAGNVGSEDRHSYLLVGDTINVAARVQELSKEFEHDLLISEDTYRRLQQPGKLEPSEPMEIRGREDKLRIYRA